MTYDELLVVINKYHSDIESGLRWEPDCFIKALRAVVELHKPELDGLICKECTASESEWYPCDTIRAIVKELS